jgi:hypothetical protein
LLLQAVQRDGGLLAVLLRKSTKDIGTTLTSRVAGVAQVAEVRRRGGPGHATERELRIKALSNIDTCSKHGCWDSRGVVLVWAMKMGRAVGHVVVELSACTMMLLLMVLGRYRVGRRQLFSGNVVIVVSEECSSGRMQSHRSVLGLEHLLNVTLVWR